MWLLSSAVEMNTLLNSEMGRRSAYADVVDNIVLLQVDPIIATPVLVVKERA